MRKEAKKYLSLYLLQHAKIQRLKGQIAACPEKEKEYRENGIPVNDKTYQELEILGKKLGVAW